MRSISILIIFLILIILSCKNLLLDIIYIIKEQEIYGFLLPSISDYSNIAINSGTVIFCNNIPVQVSPNNIPIVNETVLESIPSFNKC